MAETKSVDPQTLYPSKVDEYLNQLKKVKKQMFFTSVARLFSFILFLAGLYLSFRATSQLSITLSLVSFIFFLWLVKRSNDLNDKKLLLEKLHFVNENEWNITRNGKNKFDSGASLQTNESYYADLDIFGEESLFHLLNRTSTKHGYHKLEQLLKHSFTLPSTIKAHQEAIKTLAPQYAVREQIIAQALLNEEGKGNINEIALWLEQPPILINNKWIGIARYLLPVINFLVLLTCLQLDNYYALTLPVFICWLHVGYFAKHTNKEYVLLGNKQKLLNQYAAILKEFQKVEYRSSSVLEENFKIASEAYAEVRKLSQLSNLLDQRLNLLVNILLNSFLMYDVQVMLGLEKWKEKNKHNLHKWIDCVATIECLTSLSAYAFNHPHYSYPVVAEDGLMVEAKELAHPLIRQDESVSNDITLGRASQLLLITGSNMSGKTTFLRTVGINTLLAQCGAPVCAASFTFTPVHIYSSIRISDSLQEHTSYFMAELKRLSEIKESLASQQPSLVLIDEILRGTNSEDKYYGSAEFVKKLINYNCLALFATHDLKLSELENEYPGKIENYCFESIIENDELKFDYHILKGIAQNKNASFLMKKMKII